ILLFAGSLYAMAFTGVRGLGAITPIGGATFLAGWVALAAAAPSAHPPPRIAPRAAAALPHRTIGGVGHERRRRTPRTALPAARGRADREIHPHRRAGWTARQPYCHRGPAALRCRGHVPPRRGREATPAQARRAPGGFGRRDHDRGQ